MIKKMLLDNNELHLSDTDLPLLIHGDDGYGASLFSVSVMANLYSQGKSVIFLCGYHMARDEFELQTQSKQDSVLARESSKITEIEGKRVVFIPSDQPELLHHVLRLLHGANDRVVFFKNFDLFEESVFVAVENTPRLVMMGNIDKCAYAAKILHKDWATRIFFSTPKTDVGIKIPKVEKYKGFLKSGSKQGTVSLVT